MSKSDKLYKIFDRSTGDKLYECPLSTEANRVYDLIRFIKPEIDISLVIELRKA